MSADVTIISRRNQRRLINRRQKYNNNIRITLIYRDDNYINDILSYLNTFINNFENKFLNNEIALENLNALAILF